MDEAQSAIFPENSSAAEKPVDYLANPVRVQTAELTGARYDQRPYTRLDLIALATAIVRIEADHVRITGILTDIRTSLANLDGRVMRFEDNPSDGKISRMLRALARIEAEFDDDSDPEDPY